MPVDADSEGKIKAREVVAVLKNNKYIYIVAAMSILYNITLGMNASSYYFTYIVGDISKYMLLSLIHIYSSRPGYRRLPEKPLQIWRPCWPVQ